MWAHAGGFQLLKKKKLHLMKLVKLLTNSSLSKRVRNLCVHWSRNSSVHWAYASGGLQPSELLCALLSYAAPHLATLHPWATLNAAELFVIAAPYWATLHPTALHCILFLNHAATSALHCTVHTLSLSYAAPYWAVLRSTELRCTLMRIKCHTLQSSTAPWCYTLHMLRYPSPLHNASFLLMLHPSELRHTFWEMLHLTKHRALYRATLHLAELRCTHWTGLYPIELWWTLLSYAAHPMG